MGEVNLQRARYKLTFGVATSAGDWYSDFAMAMGAKGRSDNADFGNLQANEVDSKQALFVKRAMIGWKATDWMTLEAGRMANPLYTSSMVWDADLNVEGLAEKFKYTMGDTDFFATAVQSEYLGIRKLVGGAVAGAAPSTWGGVSGTAANGSLVGTAEMFAFQAGLRHAFNSNLTGKGALTYTTYSKNPYTTNFGDGQTGYTAATTGTATLTTATATTVVTVPVAAINSVGNGVGSNQWGVNDLNVIEIPAEFNYMASNNIGIRLYEHFAWNTSADDRARNANIGLSGAGSDDKAWSVGFVVGSAKDLKAFEGNKMAKGDWNAKIWYQSVGAWAVDAALVDSDIFEGRVNMEGTAFKAQYNVADNVLLNFTGAWGQKKNANLYAFGIGDVSSRDIDKLDLYQFDLTYKF